MGSITTQREAHCTESATGNHVAEAAVTCFTGAGAAAWGSLLRNWRGTLCTLLAPLSPAGCIGASTPEPVLSSPRTYSCGSQTFLWSRFWQIKAGIGVRMTLSPVPPKLCFVKVTSKRVPAGLLEESQRGVAHRPSIGCLVQSEQPPQVWQWKQAGWVPLLGAGMGLREA